MTPKETIHINGEVINTGDAYERGCDVLGAGPPKAATKPGVQFRMKPTPAGNQIVSMSSTSKQHDHKTSIKNAKTAGNRAISVGTKLANALKTKKPTAIHGAVTTAKRPHKLLTPAQIKKISDQALSVGKDLLKQADKHESARSALEQKKNAAVSTVQSKMGLGKGKGSIKINGDVFGACADILGEYIDIVAGEVVADIIVSGLTMDGSDAPVSSGNVFSTAQYASVAPSAGSPVPAAGSSATGSAPVNPTNPPDPNNPGLLMDGTPDPNYATGDGTAPGTAGPPDYGFGPAPTVAPALVPGQDFIPDPGYQSDQTFYSSVPGSTPSGAAVPTGAVVYDGSKGYPLDGFTSFKRAAAGAGSADGYFFSGDSAHSGSGWAPMTWYKRLGGQSYGLPANNTEIYDHPGGPDGSWGPLVGDFAPGIAGGDNSWLKGLRYDYGTHAWFWFYDMAPKWATAADDMTRLIQAVTDYKTNVTQAATDAAAQAAQDQLDAQTAAAQAKQQAAEDAQTAHQQDLDQKQAEHDAGVQQLADEAASRQQATADTSAAAQQASQMDADIKAQQAQAEIDRAQQQQEFDQGERAYAAAQAAGQVAPDQGSGGDGGGYDDMGPVPTTGEEMLDDGSDMLSGTERMKSHTWY